MEKTKVRSIKTKIGLLLTVVVVLTGLTMILTYSTNLKNEMNTMTERYIDDLALAYGSTLDNEIKASGGMSAVLGKKTSLPSLPVREWKISRAVMFMLRQRTEPCCIIPMKGK